jgi:hypothetical protein
MSKSRRGHCALKAGGTALYLNDHIANEITASQGPRLWRLAQLAFKCWTRVLDVGPMLVDIWTIVKDKQSESIPSFVD